jgi:mannose-1-phosphate guanylyltransferase
MEKSHKVDVTCADFGWSDLGTWTSLYEQSGKDEAENVLSGEQIIANDTRNCFVKELNPDKLVVADSLEDLLVVDTEDVLLICPRTDEGRVKQIIEGSVSLKKEYK